MIPIIVNNVERLLFNLQPGNENSFVQIFAGEHGGHSIKTIGV